MAVCHSFTTTATGGIFPTKQDSVAYWNFSFYRVCDSYFYGPVGNKLFIIFYVPEKENSSICSKTMNVDGS